MKIIITGSLGNISRPLAIQLIKAGHQVSIVSSTTAKTTEIEALGAFAAIGSVEDVNFLTNTFAGADVIYTMVPQQPQSDNYKAFIKTIGKKYAEAIKAASITKVVHLSSIGAHIPSGTGPITGMHSVEEIFNDLDGVSIKYLRPASFYFNFYHNIDMIKHMGILGANYGENTRLVLVHPEDIADAAFEEITQPFAGKSIRYIASDDLTAGEITGILGTAIGKPDLKWVEFSDEQSVEGIKQGGLSEDVAKNLTEMGTATRSGILWEDYDKHEPVLGKRKFKAFANDFAVKFNS